MSDKRLILLGVITTFVIVMVVVFSFLVLKTPPEKPLSPKTRVIRPQPEKVIPESEYFLGRRKRKIKPLVVDSISSVEKPRESLNISEWYQYYQALYSRFIEDADPQYLERLKQEIKRRYPPNTEERVKQLDIQISKMKEELKKNPQDQEIQEKLKKLVKVKAHWKALKQAFLK